MERPRSSDRIGLAGGELHRGEKIGKYEVLTQLGLGGMAELFLCFTAGPGGFRKYVVVKRILPDARANEHFVKMFLDEARITAAFNHPNIAQVFDLGEEEDGLYLAMEFIAGQNVNQITRVCANQKTVLPIGFSAAVVREICNALHYAHTFTDAVGRPSPIIHRDVAQKNVMVTYEGAVKLLDFGIAKAKRSLNRTHVGTVKGTTGYMSPEQVRGQELDGRSDVFCAGVMLHELVTGRRLFAGETELEEMKLVVEASIPRPEEVEPIVPHELSEVVMRALARERADRYQSAREFARALERAAGGLLFEQEQRAAFLRELFEKKMDATRALLESAEGTDSSPLVRSAVQLLREDAGMVFPSSEKSLQQLAAAREGARAGRERREEEVQLESLRLELGAASLEEPRRSSLWMLLVLAAVAGLAVLAFRALVPPKPEAEEDQQADPPPGLVPYAGELPPLPQFGAKPKASPAAPSAPAAEPAAPETAPAEEKSAEEKPAAKRARAAGTLTLLTSPEAEVREGRSRLGQTPLFNLALPAGTHRLTLVGPDGKRRFLSVPISAGKNTAFRIRLEDVPEK
ncbi:MAG: serine/threonine protein kinase [Myxococcales bacterium]|nr:serine/threonine protein kinase [Myxococcales bacterium]